MQALFYKFQMNLEFRSKNYYNRATNRKHVYLIIESSGGIHCMFCFSPTITKKDMMRFKMYWFTHTTQGLFLIAVFLLLIIGLPSYIIDLTKSYIINLTGNDSYYFYIYFYLLSFVLILALIPARAARDKRQDYPIQQTWRFDNDLIKGSDSNTPLNQQQFLYTAIKNIKSTKGDVYIFLNAGKDCFIFLPCDVFRNEEERKDFLQFIRAKMQEEENVPAAVPPMEAVYTETCIYQFDVHLNLEDYNAFLDYYHNHAASKTPYMRLLKQRPRLRMALIIIVLIFVNILAFALMFVIDCTKSFLIFLLLCDVLFLCLAIYSQKQRQTGRESLHKKKHLPSVNLKGVYNKHSTLSFYDAWFWCSTPNAQEKLGYEFLKSVETTPQAVYLFVNANSAFILPSDCFLDEKQREDFIQFITAKISKAAQEEGGNYVAGR